MYKNIAARFAVSGSTRKSDIAYSRLSGNICFHEPVNELDSGNRNKNSVQRDNDNQKKSSGHVSRQPRQGVTNTCGRTCCQTIPAKRTVNTGSMPGNVFWLQGSIATAPRAFATLTAIFCYLYAKKRHPAGQISDKSDRAEGCTMNHQSMLSRESRHHYYTCQNKDSCSCRNNCQTGLHTAKNSGNGNYKKKNQQSKMSSPFWEASSCRNAFTATESVIQCANIAKIAAPCRPSHNNGNKEQYKHEKIAATIILARQLSLPEPANEFFRSSAFFPAPQCREKTAKRKSRRTKTR